MPKLVTRSDQPNRADQGNTILANEYLDAPEVLDRKVEILVSLIKRSQRCVLYTGAGLSKSAGIPDYATKSKNSIVSGPELSSSLQAQPTLAHHVIASMERANLVKYYVQQNHDGLPQKAGFPQEKINEIHGAWFDPSNPVVPFSGQLRGDLFDGLLNIEQCADLCLCLGTSLSGMNADRVAVTPAEKFKRDGAGLGTVVINLQKTPLDDRTSLRIWAKLDDVFEKLALALELEVPDMANLQRPGARFEDGDDVFEVPYDELGRRDTRCQMKLDLSKGRPIWIVDKEAPNLGMTGEVLGKDRDGNFVLGLGERRQVMGWWWIDAAQRGAVAQLPIANTPAVVRRRADLEIVQSHRLLEQKANRHRWGLRLNNAARGWVTRVDWHLHPTFSPAVVRCDEAPFEIFRDGWGTFEVCAEIFLRDRRVVVRHQLSFEEEGERVVQTPVALESKA